MAGENLQNQYQYLDLSVSGISTSPTVIKVNPVDVKLRRIAVDAQ